MGFLIHTLLHFLVGASLFYLICNKDFKSKRNRIVLVLFGGVTGVLPDATKFFGDLFGHSILSVPLFGLVLTIVFRVFLKDVSFKKAWFAFSITVLFGHLFIDYIGNGIAVLYPFIQKEFDFHIVKSDDNMIIFTLLVAIIVGMFYKKGRWIILSGILVVSLYLGVLAFSKIQLEQALRNKYQDDNITLLLTYPRFDNQWGFMVRTDKVWVNGYSPMLSTEIHIEEQNKVSD
jgi:hypothetical protein